ncbi:hypothetical protein AB0I10_28200 [Streptomyces sp. NPDC050636]|uniref:hypothetical protein n=1 Tax=Streptomyces sp. NPDC050636 TaxID=3154510 RepID=UPI003413D077
MQRTPDLAVLRGVLPVLRSVAEVPRPRECAHSEEHPKPRDAKFLYEIPHFDAPREFPPPENTISPEAWTCPRFIGELPDKGREELEDLAEDEG